MAFLTSKRNMWTTEIESKIVEHGRRGEKKELAAIRGMLLTKHNEASYMLSRFMAEYGEKIDDDKKVTDLFRRFSNDYSSIERLLTIINCYDR